MTGRDRDGAHIGGHELHSLASTFAELTPEEQEAVERSVATAGLLVPILRHRGLVLEGCARLRACIKIGVEPRFQDLADDADPLRALLAAILDRRHLTRPQRALAAARVATLGRGRPEKGQTCTFTTEEAAKRFGISARLVKSARAVSKRHKPALVDVVERGLVSVTRAEVLAALDDGQLDAVLEKVGRAATAVIRAAIIRDALEAAGLEAVAGSAPNRRMKTSLEVLAAHVRSADEPADALGAVFEDLARQAGIALQEPAKSLVEPKQDEETAEPEGEQAPSLPMVDTMAPEAAETDRTVQKAL